ncbi:TPA: hypothetical protein MI535_01930 [Klebsiella pneumoniae]|nr:hypothetical protein [Klebsiella pneumoniae]
MTSKLTKERLQEIAEDGFLKHGESKELARMALAAMDGEPVIVVGDDGGDALSYRRLIQSFEPSTKLYRHAQTAPVVPDDVSIFEAAIEECKTCDSIDEHAWNHGVLAVIAKYESCRAAMLQELKKSAGTEAICRSDENVQVLHTKSPAQSDCCPAENHVSPEQNSVAPAQSGNSQAIPDGYVLVPKEATKEILDEFDSIIDYGAEDSVDAWHRLLAAATQEE